MRKGGYLLILGLFLFSAALAQNFYLNDTYEMRWDNITKHINSALKHGVKYDHVAGISAITIAPKSEIIIPVPARHELKIKVLSSNVATSEFQFEFSHDATLWKPVKLNYSAKDSSWYLVLPEERASVLKLSWRPTKTNRNSHVSLACFLSRQVKIPERETFRQVYLPKYHAYDYWSLRRFSERFSERFWPMRAGQRYSFTIIGPKLIRLDTMRYLTGNTIAGEQSYWLKLNLDNRPYHLLRFETLTTDNAIYFSHNNAKLFTDLQYKYINVPKGKHVLNIVTVSPIFMRLIKPQHRLLFSGLNSYVSLPYTKTLQQDDLYNWLAKVYNNAWSNDADQHNPVFINKIKINDYAYPQNSRVHLLHRLLQNQYVYYRNLFPAEKTTRALQQYYPVAATNFQFDFMPPLRRFIPFSYMLDMQQQQQGLFLQQVPRDQKAALVYKLIHPSKFARDMRINIVTRSQMPAKLYLQFNNHAPQVLMLRKFKLNFWQPRENIYMPVSLLLPRVYSTEITLPAQTKTIRVWSSNSTSQLSLQLLTKKPHYLAEDAYYDLTRNVTKRVLWSWFQRALHGHNLKQFPANELANNWQPFIDYLHGRKKAVQPFIGAKIKETYLSKTKISALLRNANKYQRKKLWYKELTYRTKLVRGSRGRIKLAALQRQIQLLEKLQVPSSTINRILTYEYFHIDLNLRKQLLQILLANLNKSEDLSTVERFLGYSLCCHPDLVLLETYTKVLVTKGEFRFALTAGLLLPKSQQPVIPMLVASYHEHWWRTYNDLLLRLPTKQQQYLWRGYEARFFGDFSKMRDDWLLAGAEGQRLLNIFAASGKATNLTKWSQLLQQMPGSKNYEFAPWLVKDYAGAVTLTSLTKRMAPFFRATRAHPVILKAVGPTTLILDVRPIHYNYNLGRINANVTIVDNGAISNHYISSSYPSISFFRDRAYSWLPGQGSKIELKLTAGLHIIKIYSRNQSLLLRQEQLVPAMSVAMLPLQYKNNKPDVYTLMQSNAFSRYQPNVFTTQNPYPFQLQIHGDYAKPQKLTNSLMTQMTEFINSDNLYEAEMLYHQNSQNQQLRSLWLDVSNRLTWKFVKTVQSDNGVYLQRIKGKKPDSESIKLVQALSGVTNLRQQLLGSTAELKLFIKDTKATHLGAKIQLVEPTRLRSVAASVQYGVNKYRQHILTLTPKIPQKEFRLTVPAGEHLFYLKLKKAVRGQYLAVEIYKKTAKGKEYFIPQQTKMYYLASKPHPVEVFVTGPTVLRIDEYAGMRFVRSVYKYVPAGAKQVAIKGLPGKNLTYVRIFKREIVKPINYQERPLFLDNTNLYLSKSPSLNLPNLSKWPYTNSTLPLQGQDDGVWSAHIGADSRISETNAEGPADHAIKAGVDYNYYNAVDNWYYQGGGFVRVHQHGLPTGSLNSLLTGYWQPSMNLTRFRWWFEGDVFGQDINTSTLKKFAYSAHVLAGIGQNRQLAQWFNHFPYITIFYRYQSLDSLLSSERQEVDEDIFTQYKNDHRYGLRIGDTVSFHPFWDTDFYLGARLSTNENFWVGHPDVLRARIGWIQQFRYVQANIGYKMNYYFGDSDRNESYDTKLIYIDLTIDSWLRFQKRLGIFISLGYDPDHGRYVGGINLAWFGGNGRGMRDFAPGSMFHRALRQRFAPKYNVVGDMFMDTED